MIPVDPATLLGALVIWALNKGIPAIFHAIQAKHQTQVTQADNLCEKHNDCEAQKIQALQGMKSVVRLEAKPIDKKGDSTNVPSTH